MKRNDFLDIKIMKKSIAKKRKDDCGEGFKFTNIHEMVLEEGFVGFHFRYNFDDEAVRWVDLSKRNALMKTIDDLNVANPEGVKINWLKFNDFLQLLKYVSPIHHAFYKNVKHDKSNDDDFFSGDV